MKTNVIQLGNSKEKIAAFDDLRKKSDRDILDLFTEAENRCLYYENADSFEQSYRETAERLKAYEDKAHIGEFITRFRPQLKGRI